MSCCFISCLTCLRRSTSFLISLGRIPISRLESGISGISSWSSSCYHRNNTVSVCWHFAEHCYRSPSSVPQVNTHTPHSFSASCEPLSARWWSRYWTPGWLRGTGCWSQATAQTCHKNLQKKDSEGFQEQTNETPMRQNRPKKKKPNPNKTKSSLTNFGIQHQTSSIGGLFLPLAFPHSTSVFSFSLKRSKRVKGVKDANRNFVTVFNFTISSWVFLKEGLSGTM